MTTIPQEVVELHARTLAQRLSDDRFNGKLTWDDIYPTNQDRLREEARAELEPLMAAIPNVEPEQTRLYIEAFLEERRQKNIQSAEQYEAKAKEAEGVTQAELETMARCYRSFNGMLIYVAGDPMYFDRAVQAAREDEREKGQRGEHIQYVEVTRPDGTKHWRPSSDGRTWAEEEEAGNQAGIDRRNEAVRFRCALQEAAAAFEAQAEWIGDDQEAEGGRAFDRYNTYLTCAKWLRDKLAALDTLEDSDGR